MFSVQCLIFKTKPMKGRAIDSLLHILDPTLISRLIDSVYYFYYPLTTGSSLTNSTFPYFDQTTILRHTYFILNNFQLQPYYFSLPLSSTLLDKTILSNSNDSILHISEKKISILMLTLNS